MEAGVCVMRLFWMGIGDAIAAIVAAYIIFEYVSVAFLGNSNPPPDSNKYLIAFVIITSMLAGLAWWRVWARGRS